MAGGYLQYPEWASKVGMHGKNVQYPWDTGQVQYQGYMAGTICSVSRRIC